MDIIASHRHGLTDLLRAEADGLAGRGCDGPQRAAAFHHLYQHSGGNFGFGLVAALDAVARPERGWRWRSRAARAAHALAREEARECSRRACAESYFAYRLSAMPVLRAEAERRLDPALLDALDRMHAHRRAGRLAPLAERRALFEAFCAWLDSDPAKGLAAFDQIERGGWQRAEARLKGDRLMPRRFADNPAQHFYAIQRSLAERRRKPLGDWAEIDGDDSVRLAA